MKSHYIFFLLLPGCHSGQDSRNTLAGIDAMLAKGQATISGILSDKAYMPLHSLTSFREIIRKHAKPGKIRIITADEPGKKITVKGIVETANSKPLNNALLYFYHT